MASDDDSFKRTIAAALGGSEGRAIRKLYYGKLCYAFGCKNFTPLDNEEINRIIQDLLTKDPRMAPTMHADHFLAWAYGEDVKFFEAEDTQTSLSKASFETVRFRDVTGDRERVQGKVKELFRNRRPKKEAELPPCQPDQSPKRIRLATDATVERVKQDPSTIQRPTHAELQKRIRLATDVTDFDILYTQMDFIMERVNQAQLAYGKGRWEWCVKWAIARFHQEEWTDGYEMDRKTALLLLEYVWRRYQPDSDDPEGFGTLTRLNVVKDFGTDKIDHILNIFLCMDKAVAFYKMAPLGIPQPPPGLSWYCKLHTPEELQEHKVTPNASGRGPLNRRYVELFNLANEYMDQKEHPHIGEHWKHWMVPEMPPSDRFARLGIDQD